MCHHSSVLYRCFVCSFFVHMRRLQSHVYQLRGLSYQVVRHVSLSMSVTMYSYDEIFSHSNMQFVKLTLYSSWILEKIDTHESHALNQYTLTRYFQRSKCHNDVSMSNEVTEKKQGVFDGEFGKNVIELLIHFGNGRSKSNKGPNRVEIIFLYSF